MKASEQILNTVWKSQSLADFAFILLTLKLQAKGVFPTNCTYFHQFELEGNKKDILHKMIFFDAMQMSAHSVQAVGVCVNTIHICKAVFVKRLVLSMYKVENEDEMRWLQQLNHRSRLGIKLNKEGLLNLTVHQMCASSSCQLN